MYKLTISQWLRDQDKGRQAEPLPLRTWDQRWAPVLLLVALAGIHFGLALGIWGMAEWKNGQAWGMQTLLSLVMFALSGLMLRWSIALTLLRTGRPRHQWEHPAALLPRRETVER